MCLTDVLYNGGLVKTFQSIQFESNKVDEISYLVDFH